MAVIYCHLYLIENKLEKLIKIDCVKFSRKKYDINEYFKSDKYVEIENALKNNANKCYNDEILSKKIEINLFNSIHSEEKINNLESKTIYPSKIKINDQSENDPNKRQIHDKGEILVESYLESPKIKNQNNDSLNNSSKIEDYPEKDFPQDSNRLDNKSIKSDLTRATQSGKYLIKINKSLKMKDEKEFNIVEEDKEYDISINVSKEIGHFGNEIPTKNHPNKNPENMERSNILHENEVTLRDYLELRADEACKYDKRRFCSIFSESFLMKHKFLNLYFKISLFDPLWKRVLLLVTFITLSLTFNAFLFTDNLIEYRSLNTRESRVCLIFVYIF